MILILELQPPELHSDLFQTTLYFLPAVKAVLKERMGPIQTTLLKLEVEHP